MKVSVEYTEEVQTSFHKTFLLRIATETLTLCPGITLKQHDVLSLTAIAVSPERIRELNRDYRKKDAVTDILSFGEYEDMEALARDQSKRLFLGELFFCYDFIVAAAVEDAVSVEHEMVYIFSHGILHLLGYDHSEEMFAIQDAVTENMISTEARNEYSKNKY